MDNTYVFIDGAFLREFARAEDVPLINPWRLFERVGQGIPGCHQGARFFYYDAIDEKAGATPIESYWDALALEKFTHLGFGKVKWARKRGRYQKQVDTLLSLDMIVGAFNKSYTSAVLIAGDSDFVPVIEEVRRLGIATYLLSANSDRTTVSEELIASADEYRHFALEDFGRNEGHFFPLIDKGSQWWKYDGDDIKIVPVPT